METEPLNTIPIQQFIKKVKSADFSNEKNLTLTLTDAKSLAYCLGIVMARLEGNLEQLLIKPKDNELIQISVDGGNSW